MPLTWNDSLRVGIPEIDRQHQSLAHMINGLHSMLKKEQSRDAQLTIIKQLVVHAKEHFATEEDWFKRYQYPQAESHIQHHQELLKQVVNFMDDLENDKHGVEIRLCLFLSDWLEFHLKDDDQQYCEFFKSLGGP